MTATPVNGLSSWNLGCAALLIVVGAVVSRRLKLGVEAALQLEVGLILEPA